MTMKILSPTERQNIEQGKRARVREVNELLSTGKVKFPGISGWLPASVKGDESAEAKPLDYVKPYRGAKLNSITVDEEKYAKNFQFTRFAVDPGHNEGTAVAYAVAKPGLSSGFAIKAIRAKPRYTGNNLEVEAKIALEMEARDHERAREKSVQDSRPIFHPTSLSAFVQDQRIMRKGPWK